MKPKPTCTIIRLNCEETKPMNLSAIQTELDSALHAIKIGGPYREFALERLCYAFQLLVNELARIAPEHPELTEKRKP